MPHHDCSIRDALRVRPGTVNLAGYDTGATPLAPGKKDKTLKDTLSCAPVLAGAQERLWAEGRRSVLLVLQGIDTAGKGGVVSHVVEPVRPGRCEGHRLQEAHRRGDGAPFPVAYSQGASGTRASSGSSTGPTTRT